MHFYEKKRYYNHAKTREIRDVAFESTSPRRGTYGGRQQRRCQNDIGVKGGFLAGGLTADSMHIFLLILDASAGQEGGRARGEMGMWVGEVRMTQCVFAAVEEGS